MSKSKFPRLALIGATGRLGAKIIEIHEKEFNSALRIIYRIHKENVKEVLTDLESVDGILDVSVPEASVKIMGAITDQKIRMPYVVGCTGWTSGQMKSLQQYAKTSAVVFAPNFAPGVNLLLDLVEKASLQMRNWGYETILTETHHNKKKDSPSGTAKLMLEKLGSNAKPQVASFRAGNIVGTHKIQFVGPGDILSIEHEALDRGIFARGALMASTWVLDRTKPGVYSMSDVLKV